MWKVKVSEMLKGWNQLLKLDEHHRFEHCFLPYKNMFDFHDVNLRNLTCIRNYITFTYEIKFENILREDFLTTLDISSTWAKSIVPV